VFDFLKRTTWVDADATALGIVGPAAVALAEAEGLSAHARSIALRLGQGVKT
jgi:histidinol dehydrogenase